MESNSKQLPRTPRAKVGVKSKKTILTQRGQRDKYVPYSTDFLPDASPGVNLKKSNRVWIDPPVTSNRREIPHINSVGLYSGFHVMDSLCTSSQFIATTISTIGSRLLNHLIKHKGYREAVRNKHLCVRLAYCYAMTKCTWIIDRYLAITRAEGPWSAGRKFLNARIRCFVVSMDDNNRFVYGQVCSQTNWLLSRGSRASPRDKSLFKSRNSKPGSRMAAILEAPRMIRVRAYDIVSRDFAIFSCADKNYHPHMVALGPAMSRW